MSMYKNDLYDRVRGALFGFAIGDAMGATTEFMSKEEVKKKFAKQPNKMLETIVGGGWLKLKPGQVTDDTQMMLCVLAAWDESRHQGDFIRLCAKNFIEWAENNPPDIGRQCNKGIAILSLGGRISYDEDALGNGSLMRALPMALLGRLNANWEQGKLTHNNRTCDDEIQLYTQAIQAYLHGTVPPRAKRVMQPAGCVVNTLNNALYYSERFGLRSAIVFAVNDGGDADTIGALTGSLAGAKFGYNQIPQEWLQKLDKQVAKQLEDYAEKLTEEIWSGFRPISWSEES